MTTTKEFDREVISHLQEKIKLIKTDKGAIYLVGPIKLPVNLLGDTAQFHWYCWLKASHVDYEQPKKIRRAP